MRHFSKLFCFLLAFALAGGVNAQLNPGDIAFVSYDADGTDAVSFLALTTIPSGTEIKFTDNGWQSSTNSFRANEGTWIVTFNTDIACGTEVIVTAAGATDVMGNSVGGVTPAPGNAVALAASGDQVLAYQGDEASPSFIAAINNDGAAEWQADATSSNTSALPPGLTNGTTAVAVNEIDNITYLCTVESGTRADLLAAINNPANWSGSDTSPQVPASCLFNPTDCSSGPGGGGGEDCMDLFISEYVEGGGNNKCLEIYNPTGGPVDLSGYVLNRYSNGSTSAVAIALSGPIPALGTYVICNPSSTADFLAVADATNGNISHNGDDAYTLENNGVVIDRVGQVGVDPGTQWSGGGVSTLNQTLVRKESVAKGDPNSGDPFDPSAEWDGYPQDESSFLGAHTSVCGQGGPGGSCSELFISEYIEGSSFEKYIEVYNPTSGPVDLADYELRLYSNGSTTPNSSSLAGGGVLQSGEVAVFRNGSAALYPSAVSVGAVNFNGDDAVELYNTATGSTADIFGVIGQDPGSAWTAPGYSTVNMTLRRLASVQNGVTTNPAGSFATLETEWEALPQDDVSGLGFHLSDCVVDLSCLITSVTINPIGGCQDDGSSSQDDDYYYAEIVVAVNNPPSTGDLELYGPNGFITEISASSITGGEAVFSFVELPANALPVTVTASFTAEDCSADGMAPPVYPCSLPNCTPVINELDYNNPGTDDREFVELYNPCSQAINLGNYSVIFVNGANGEIYGDFQLPSVMLGPGEFFVICGDGANTPNCDLDVSPNTNLIQNGDPDAVALLYIQAIADAVSYEGSTTGFTEGSGDGLFDLAGPQLGIGRYVDGVDTDRNNVDFSIQCITPGEPNTSVSQYCSIPDDITVTPISCAGFNDAEYDAGTDTYTLTSACAHYFGAQDQELLVGKDACGYTSEVSARIVSVVPSIGYAGVTMRESDAPGARKMSIIRYADGRKVVEYRPYPNAPFYQYWLPAFTIYYDYVRISRWGDYFFAAVSYDGYYWMNIYQQYMGGMPNCVKAGMAVSSYFDGAITQASFSNFNVAGSAIPPRPLDPGTINPEEAVSFNVFPNPVVNELSVTIGNAPAEEAAITILALDGRELYRGVHNINGNTVNLQLAPLQMTPGLYILTVNTGEEVLTKRFVKANP